MLPQSFSWVPSLETLIPSQAGYPKCMEEVLRQFPLWFLSLLGAGWSQEKAGAQLQDIDGFPALCCLLLWCGGKCPSPVAEEKGADDDQLCYGLQPFSCTPGEQRSRVFTLNRPTLIFL